MGITKEEADRMNENNRTALSLVQGLQSTDSHHHLTPTLNRKAAAVANQMERSLAGRRELEATACDLGYTLEHLGVTIGTVIHGADLSVDQTAQQLAFFHDALRERKVIFFRKQDITTDQQLNFSRNFGHLEVHPFIKAKSGFPEVVVLDHDESSPGQENEWHSDVTWRQAPSMGSILRCLENPAAGGDTHFADMYLAFDGLPEDLKERVRGLKAIHSNFIFMHGLQVGMTICSTRIWDFPRVLYVLYVHYIDLLMTVQTPPPSTLSP
jgi:alpha-ketoglutarate-dependent taurine dioxygenase